MQNFLLAFFQGKMDTQNLHVLPIHKYPEYLKGCCDLINDEWPRSETARMMTLQTSREELPTNFILVNGSKNLIGHCKLTPIPSIPESCFVETVVIHKAMRGKKLGSFLMRYVEDYCRNTLGLKLIHLSTKGQEDFYAKLGYEVCAPVSIYGSGVPSSLQPTALTNKPTSSVPTQTGMQAGPPPPPMPINSPLNINNTIKSTKTFMFKHL